MAPELDYGSLQGVKHGTEAQQAYLEAIDKETSEGRKSVIEGQLLKYCEYDTLAMVKIVEYFSDATPNN